MVLSGGVHKECTNFDSELRNVKLKIITEGFKFSIKSSVLNKMSIQLDMVKSTFFEDIITGSLALNLYDLIYRDISDIDIIIKDSERYANYIKYSAYSETENISNLGYKMMAYKKNIFSKSKEFKIDFFKNDEAKFNTFIYRDTELKIQDPLQIITEKLKIYELSEINGNMSRIKHRSDLFEIFKRIN
jgi:hypothetical protein